MTGFAMRSLIWFCTFAWLGLAHAEELSFPGAKADGFASVESVNGNFQLPTTVQAKMPAIVILHGSAGIDGRGAFHARGLNQAGFATLEVFMFPPGGRNKAGHESTLTHAYGALRYLASRPDIDAERIGAMGFSWGGNMTLKLASEHIRLAFANATGPARFNALASFYPVCWQHLATATSEKPEAKVKYSVLTGAPLLLLAGGQDDYGAPDDCQKFIAALPPSARQFVEFEFYPDATHGWDMPAGRDRTIQDPVAHQGRGGPVRMSSSSATAEASRKRTIAHFQKHLPSR